MKLTKGTFGKSKFLEKLDSSKKTGSLGCGESLSVKKRMLVGASIK